MMFVPVSLLSLLPSPAPAEAPPQDVPLASAPVADEDEPPPLGWSGAFAIGGSITDGNTDIQRGSVTADGIHRREPDRWTLGFSWNYAEESSVVTQRRTFGKAQYDYFLTDRSYVLGDASGQADTQAQLNFRGTVGTGYGYQFVENETVKFGAEAGAAYISEDLVGVPLNEYFAARFGYDLFWKATKTVDFEQYLKLYPSFEDKDDLFGQLDTRAKLTLTEAMFAQFQWLFDYNNTPSPGRERADNLFLIGIGWSF